VLILVIGGAFQGKLDFVKNTLGIPEEKIFNEFHLRVKELIQQKGNPEEFLRSIFSGHFEVVISDEIGCGIVPMERSDRIWREVVGRALCDIASRASVVWRVQCGIGIKIKG